LSSAGDGVFVSSADGGATWQSSPIPGTGRSAFPYIAVVDPHHPSTIYVRTDSWILPDGAPEQIANDALFVSTDGGAHWTQVLVQSAKLLGFALSPDGSAVLAGYGDPVESDYAVDATVTGIYSASTNDFQFTMANPEPVTCLTWTASGIYACVEDAAAGTLTELTLFPDTAALDANSGQTLMRLSDILGPPPCCPSTDAVCVWSEVCPTLGPGACGDGGAPSLACRDAGSGESDASTVSSPGVVDGAAPPAKGLDASLASDAAAGGHTSNSGHGGGGCGAAGASAAPGSKEILVGLAIALTAVRRRRRTAV
jgi:MYXO-CTERM domain-containing protein